MRSAMLLSAASLFVLAGCGAGPSCTYTNVLTISPATAAVDSSAVAPKNQQQFTAGLGVTAKSNNGGSCAIPNVIAQVYPLWTNPDPVHITISSANDETNGIATCKGPTAGGVILTAAYDSGTSAASATAQLTCH